MGGPGSGRRPGRHGAKGTKLTEEQKMARNKKREANKKFNEWRKKHGGGYNRVPGA